MGISTRRTYYRGLCHNKDINFFLIGARTFGPNFPKISLSPKTRPKSKVKHRRDGKTESAKYREPVDLSVAPP